MWNITDDKIPKYVKHVHAYNSPTLAKSAMLLCLLLASSWRETVTRSLPPFCVALHHGDFTASCGVLLHKGKNMTYVIRWGPTVNTEEIGCRLLVSF